jgi:hypothetical protein
LPRWPGRHDSHVAFRSSAVPCVQLLDARNTVVRRRSELTGARRYQRPQPPAPADANCAVRYPGGTKVDSCPRPPTPTVRFATPAVPKSTVARARWRQLCGSLPRRYQSRQLPAPADANFAVRYPGGTEVDSCPRPPTPTVRSDTPAVPKATVARARRRQLCGSIPRRYQSRQLPAPADANCAVRYRGSRAGGRVAPARLGGVPAS